MRFETAYLVRLFAIICLLFAPTAAIALEPHEQTPAGAVQVELVDADSKGRDFQFYHGSYALLLGQSEYRFLRKLPEVRREMAQLRTTLEQHGFSVQVYYDLTASEIRHALRSFFSEYGFNPQSRLLVYFAGHGITRRVHTRTYNEQMVLSRTGYLLPVDVPKLTDENLDEEVIRHGVRLSEFVEWAQAIEVKHSLFVFDSCFSGSIFNSRGEEIADSKPLPKDYIFSDHVNLPVREFFAAGTEEQEVPAQSKFLQLFSQALLGARPAADSNRDGYLTGRELGAFLVGMVPQENPRQTPTIGRLYDNLLDRGEILFKLPAEAINVASSVARSSSQLALRPLFVGAVEDGGRGGALAQQYELEIYENFGSQGCADTCPKEFTEKKLVLSIPKSLPSNAELADVRLSCSGSCGASDYLVTVPPKLSATRRGAEAVVQAGGKASTWRLSARVLVPVVSDETATVIDISDSSVKSVAVEALQTVALATPPSITNSPKAEKESSTLPDPDLLAALLFEAEGGNTTLRRQARLKLAKLVSTYGDLATELIRGIPSGSYRYKLAVAEALARSETGWTAMDSISRNILQSEHDLVKDKTLRLAIVDALANLNAFAYYEMSEIGNPTPAGQLRPASTKEAPFAAASELKKGDKLYAISAVNLRVGPTAASGTLGTVGSGECLTVLSETLLNPQNEKTTLGGWLMVRRGCI
ncbi:caspase family protein [Aquibium sp. LZ166]|uniref:Caspase family protein n=1 Tax=Aquibium pacificus TaxID=3153579 RepID=A0ABV3SMR0_9HYPH